MNKSALTLPKLRFKGFGGELIKKNIKDVSKFIRGKKPKPLENYVSKNFNLPWIKISDIREKYLLKTETFFNESFSDLTLVVKENSLLYTIEGSPCIPFFVRMFSAIDNHIALISIQEKELNLDFYYYFLLKNKKNFEKFITGSTLLSISLSNLSNLPIYIPSLPEQQKIAHFFSLLDKQIQLWERKLELYEQIYEYFLRKLFPNKKLKNKNSTKIKIKNILNEYSIKISYKKIPLYSVGKLGIIPRQKIFSEKIKYSNDYKVKIAHPNVAIIGMGSKQIDFKVNIFNYNIGVSSTYRTFYINKDFIPEYIEKFLERNIDYFSSIYMIVSARQGKTTDIENFLEDYIEIWKNISQEEIIKKINLIKKSVYLISSIINNLIKIKKYFLENLFN